MFGKNPCKTISKYYIVSNIGQNNNRLKSGFCYLFKNRQEYAICNFFIKSGQISI
ncbi:hypothetical protein DW1_0234 [Proteiniborus sp. DW1]|nr:hypothetical protein DW1_0234 [Proteiniborus sp. DW1]